MITTKWTPEMKIMPALDLILRNQYAIIGNQGTMMSALAALLVGAPEPLKTQALDHLQNATENMSHAITPEIVE